MEMDQEVGAPCPRTRLVARSQVMMDVLADLTPIAGSDAPVLLLGESGTGKELVARELHRRSRRRERPLVSINCAAFVDALIDDELFGHERGAFTGAVATRLGRFEAADGGTLFLDEVGELPPPVQAKLLRVLQEGTFERVGSCLTRHADVRIISATHRDLPALVEQGRFRQDLYFRLRVLELRLPPLRARFEDLPDLVQRFLDELSDGRRPPLTPAAWRALRTHAFPGNVRELKHALHHAVVLAGDGPIELAHLPREIADQEAAAPPAPLARAMRAFERDHLITALRACGGNRTSTAKLLGISRKCLWEKLRGHGIGTDEIAHRAEN